MFLLAEVRAFEPLSVVHHDKLRVNKVSLQTLECVSRANRIFHSIASCVVDVKRNAVHFTLTADFKILAIVDAGLDDLGHLCFIFEGELVDKLTSH